MQKLNSMFLCILLSCICTTGMLAQTPFTAGNFVVYRVGDGASSLVNTGSPVYMDEYTPAGVLVQSIALPTTVSGANKRLIASGTATSEGSVNLSADGSCVLITGYDAAIPGVTSLSGTTAASVNRVVGVIYADGSVNTTTALTDFASANNPRTATSTDGTQIWVAGGAGNVRYTTIGSTTSTDLSNGLSNLRVLGIYDNQLYTSTASGSTYRIATIGTGLPVSGPVTMANLNGISPSTGSPYGYFFADLDPIVPGADVLYVASDDAQALRKYSLVAGTWTLNGTIGVDADDYRGVTATVSGTTVTLYCTRKGGSGATGGGEIVTLTDASGYNGAFTGTPTVLVTAATNTAFRGISLAPACTTVTWYADADGDTYGDAASTVDACAAPMGYVADNTDCDDTDENVYPGATEICDNGIDDNCDGTTDEDFINPTITLESEMMMAGITGPSSSQTPYLEPQKSGVQFTSILTVGDVVGGYDAVGIMDGIGAYDNGDTTFTILVNHEISNTLGVVRDHGFIGTFVSKWIVNKADLTVISGSDLMQQAFVYDTTSASYVPATAAFSRFCSADLPAQTALYNAGSGLGTMEKIFLNGEESGNEGRQFAHIVTGPDAGKSYELAALGNAGWENSVANPVAQDKTIVVEFDDNTTNGQVYVYIGTKTNTGSDIEKAGLTNGKVYGIQVAGLPSELSASVPAPGTAFSLIDMGYVQNQTGATLNTNSIAAGVTNWLRPEDGAWDPTDASVMYFATTNSITGPSRLWKLDFTDIANPELGGTLTALLDGTEGQKMLDNLATDNAGHILLQEDPGNNKYLARIWQYTIATDEMQEIGIHDADRYISGAPMYLTQDEESSGIVDVSSILGPGMFLLDQQSHYAITGELVEGGQLLAMYNAESATGMSTAYDTVYVNTNSGCTATGVVLGTPATSDDCSVASLTNDGLAAYPLGNTTVTWTVTDLFGNTATAEQVVIVSDEVLPTITAPAAVSIAADSSCTATGVALGTPVTADNCGVASVTNNAPVSFPVGVTTVTWTVTDNSGNFVTATQTVTVTGTAVTYYADADGDTYGDAGSTTTSCTTAPMGYVANNTDCNDGDMTVNPGATEICNGVDENCDGNIDEGVTTTFYADADSDTYGDAASTTEACSAPMGYVADATDCDDANNTVYPGAMELCDALDNNCDGNIDEGVVVAEITPAGFIDVCKGSFTTLNATTGVGYTYTWYKNGIVIPGATSSSYNANKTGNYTVEVTVTGGCTALSAATTVSLVPSPNANVSAPLGTSLCTTVKLKASYAAGNTYQWRNGATPIAGATSYTYFPTVPGTYRCDITNTFGCSRTTSPIVVTACRETTNATAEGFEVYPNPAQNEVTVDFVAHDINNGNGIIRIYDLAGQLMMETPVEIVAGSVHTSLDISSIEMSGMYLIQLHTEQSILTRQLMITK